MRSYRRMTTTPPMCAAGSRGSPVSTASPRRATLVTMAALTTPLVTCRGGPGGVPCQAWASAAAGITGTTSRAIASAQWPQNRRSLRSAAMRASASMAGRPRRSTAPRSRSVIGPCSASQARRATGDPPPDAGGEPPRRRHRPTASLPATWPRRGVDRQLALDRIESMSTHGHKIVGP